MTEDSNPTPERTNPGAFARGHRKVGGRKRGSMNRRSREAIEICERANFHPAAFLAAIAKTGEMPNPNGTTTRVSTEERIRAAVALSPFVMPKLQATQHVRPNDDLPDSPTIDINRIMEDADLVEMAQTLALAASEEEGAEPIPSAFRNNRT